jgi:hypothetical protein
MLVTMILSATGGFSLTVPEINATVLEKKLTTAQKYSKIGVMKKNTIFLTEHKSEGVDDENAVLFYAVTRFHSGPAWPC